MKRIWVISLLALFVGLGQPAFGQPIPGCGAVTTSRNGGQLQDYPAIWWNASTCVEYSYVCTAWPRAEGWVDGLSGTAKGENGAMPCVTIGTDQLVTGYGTWTVRSKHWLVDFITQIWGWAGEDRKIVVVAEPPNPDGGVPPCNNEEGDYIPEGEQYPGCESPIIISPSGRYDLTGVDQGVVFDLNSDGVKERTAWTDRDSEVYFLVMDRNEDTLIGSGAELFGNSTPAYRFTSAPTAANGFEAMAFLEAPSYGPSLADHRLDASDAAWAFLRLWRDANHNGVSEPNELLRPSEVGLLSLSLDYNKTGRRDRHGNKLRLKGKATFGNTDGETWQVPYFDVWLKTDR